MEAYLLTSQKYKMEKVYQGLQPYGAEMVLSDPL
jgi:hypothetical protein